MKSNVYKGLSRIKKLKIAAESDAENAAASATPMEDKNDFTGDFGVRVFEVIFYWPSRATFPAAVQSS